MSTLLEVKDVCKRYGKKTALDHLNLTLESGHIVGLLGPNGSGKTTLIKLINGILTPDEGEILVEGMKIGDIATCYCDPSKAERELGWKAEFGIREMCADSWRWQKNNPNGYED